jgi:hypothetical protein
MSQNLLNNIHEIFMKVPKDLIIILLISILVTILAFITDTYPSNPNIWRTALDFLFEMLFIIPFVTGFFYLTRYLIKKFKRNKTT